MPYRLACVVALCSLATATITLQAAQADVNGNGAGVGIDCCAPGPMSCQSLGFRAGNVRCSANCTINTSGCVNGRPRCISGRAPRFVPGSGEVLWDFGVKKSHRGKHCDKNFGPSDIIYHAKRDVLIVVSDKGQIAVVDPEGKSAKCFDVPGDNEALTIADPTSSSLFIVSELEEGEGVALVREWDIDRQEEVRTWMIDFPLGKENEPTNKNDGIESLAFIPEKGNPEGGTFYVGDQRLGIVRGKCTVPIVTHRSARPGKRYHCDVEFEPHGVTEISSMCYDPTATINGAKNGVLFVSADREDLILAYTPNGKYLDWKVQFPEITSPGQEGLYVDGCTAYVTSDENAKNQKIWRFRFETPGTCSDGEQNQDEVCPDVGGVCGGFSSTVEVDCEDGVDNDCDGFVDDTDSDCHVKSIN